MPALLNSICSVPSCLLTFQSTLVQHMFLSAPHTSQQVQHRLSPIILGVNDGYMQQLQHVAMTDASCQAGECLDRHKPEWCFLQCCRATGDMECHILVYTLSSAHAVCQAVSMGCAGYLAAGELLMEYAGEVIRRPLADKREQLYASQGLGLYFFALDRDHCIDATHRGNIARYINHSCT